MFCRIFAEIGGAGSETRDLQRANVPWSKCKNMEEHEPYCSKHLLRLYVGFNRDIVRRCHCHCRHVTVWQGFGGSKHLRGLWSIEATDRDFGASNEILT
jgi:hypothetical protein